eukprot:14821304-Alexandrium_andersonii.AAC.1
MSASLVGSEMCIRDRLRAARRSATIETAQARLARQHSSLPPRARARGKVRSAPRAAAELPARRGCT